MTVWLSEHQERLQRLDDSHRSIFTSRNMFICGGAGGSEASTVEDLALAPWCCCLQLPAASCQRRSTRQSPTRHHASTPVVDSRAQPLASRLLQIVLHILCCRSRRSRTLANLSGLESPSIVPRQTPTNMAWHRLRRLRISSQSNLLYGSTNNPAWPALGTVTSHSLLSIF
jgi:hypothetical protein